MLQHYGDDDFLPKWRVEKLVEEKLKILTLRLDALEIILHQIKGGILAIKIIVATVGFGFLILRIAEFLNK